MPQVPATMHFIFDGPMPEYLLSKDLILQVSGCCRLWYDDASPCLAFRWPQRLMGFRVQAETQERGLGVRHRLRDGVCSGKGRALSAYPGLH